jgi:hypothetical protein
MSTININVSKLDMGLDQVDNTSDLNKPISTATQTALDNIDLQSVTDLGNTTTDNIAFTGAVGVLFDNTSTLRKGTIDAGYGGAKGIAQVCAVGYELKWEAGRLYVMGDGGTTIREVSHNFTTTPTTTDDNTKGFIVGSRWILDNGDLYICTDVTTATAVWVLQTIDAIPTDGSTKAVESNGVFDALADKVDKVVGSRLITSAEGTILGNTSGTNTGDQTLQQVTDLGNTTTNTISSSTASFQSTVSASQIQTQTLANLKRSSLNSEGSISLSTTGTSEAKIKATNIVNDVTLEVPNKSIGSYTIATTTDLTSKVDSNTAITGATKIKITYDSKGLVTTGADATTADIADSTNKRYVTDAEKTKIDYLNTVASNVQDQLNAKVNLNTLITAGTGTKVTYDTKGLILSSTNITSSDVSGLGTLATQNGTFSGTSSGTNTGDQTFLNARVQTVTSSATVTPVSTNDLVIITAQATGLTLANPTGTFTEGQALMIRIKDNATARTIAFDTNYRAIGVTLPTTTVISKTMYLGIIYNATDGKWDIIGYNIQA